jgi:hypothetical protein
MSHHTPQQRANKALHPTAYSFGFPLVPRSKPALSAAGELGVLLLAHGLVAFVTIKGYEKISRPQIDC